jgi:hypothetical protein
LFAACCEASNRLKLPVVAKETFRMRTVFTEPDVDNVSLLVYLVHDGNLSTSLYCRRLVDTYSINPDRQNFERIIGPETTQAASQLGVISKVFLLQEIGRSRRWSSWAFRFAYTGRCTLGCCAPKLWERRNRGAKISPIAPNVLNAEPGPRALAGPFLAPSAGDSAYSPRLCASFSESFPSCNFV